MTQTTWWAPYCVHRDRRNALLHRGVSLTAQQGAESLKVVRVARDWFQWLWAGRGGVPGDEPTM